MKMHKHFSFIFSFLFAVSAFGEVPTFEAATGKDGKISFDDSFDPPAQCSFCKEMKAARKKIKPDPKDASQDDNVADGYKTMEKAQRNFKKVLAVTSEDAPLDFALQFILLFDVLDRADNSSIAVEHMAAFVENPESKDSYRRALAKVPEVIRNRVIKSIDKFNSGLEKRRQSDKREPSSAKAPGAR